MESDVKLIEHAVVRSQLSLAAVLFRGRTL
jgi:hypothetical protein